MVLFLNDNNEETDSKSRAVKPWVIIAGVISIPIVFALAILAINLTQAQSDPARQLLNRFILNLAPSQLEIEAERTALPADGESTTTIRVLLKNPEGETVESQNQDLLPSLEGEGQLTTLNPEDASARFLYQAPDSPQTSTITFRSGVLEKEVQIRAYDPTPPQTPEITSPVNGATLETARVTISGSTDPNTQISLLVDETALATVQTDDEGDFTATLDKPLGNGSHTIRAVASRPNTELTATSAPISISIEAGKPALDTSNIVIRPETVEPGQPFDVFVPTETRVEETYIIYSEVQHQLQDSNETSVFSGRLTAPNEPGTYPLSFSLVDEAGNEALFSNTANLTVKNPT